MSTLSAIVDTSDWVASGAIKHVPEAALETFKNEEMHASVHGGITGTIAFFTPDAWFNPENHGYLTSTPSKQTYDIDVANVRGKYLGNTVIGRTMSMAWMANGPGTVKPITNVFQAPNLTINSASPVLASSGSITSTSINVGNLANNGLQLFNASNYFMKGNGTGAPISNTASQTGKNQSSIVLGQNMRRRVIPSAEKLGANWLKEPWTWAKNRQFLYRNIQKVKNGTGRIFDIGGQRGRYQGIEAIYSKEKAMLIRHGLRRQFTGRWITATNGKRFRLYEWVQ